MKTTILLLLAALFSLSSSSQTFKNYLCDSIHAMSLEEEGYTILKGKYEITHVLLKDSSSRLIFADMAKGDDGIPVVYQFSFNKKKVKDTLIKGRRVVVYKGLYNNSQEALISFGYDKNTKKLDGIGISDGEYMSIYWVIPTDADKRYHDSQKQKKFGGLNKKV